MDTRWISLSSLLAASLGLALHTGCKDLECAKGTVERDGQCMPSDGTVSNAMCGPFTTLQGDKCVPMFPPTECDPTTTEEEVDQATGVTTCKGTGMAGCGSPITCPTPAAGKQTICGQLYDLEDATATPAKFQASTQTGNKCAAGSTDGPCGVTITPYDALQFAASPATAQPLAVEDVYVDDCGRYRLTNVTLPGGPFIGLGVDDINTANRGPAGITNTVGVALPKASGVATKDFEAWIAKKSTTDMWTASGGPVVGTPVPPTSGTGVFVGIYRAHRVGFENQPGVTVTKNGSPQPANDFYFQAAETTRRTVDAAANVTGANGTALILGAVASQGPVFSGSGGLPAECVWEPHAGGTIPGIVFVGLFRPANAIGQTCPL